MAKQNETNEKPTYNDLKQRVKILEETRSTQSRAKELLKIIQLSVDKSVDSVFLLRPDARFIYVNEAACRSLGYSQEQLLGMTVYDVDPDVTPDNWPDHWNDIKKRGSFTLESHHRTKNGRIFPIEVTVNFIEVEGSEYNCAFVRDITERQQAEEARQKSEERLSLALEATSDGIWDWYVDYDVAYASPRCCELLGIESDVSPIHDLESWSNRIHPDDHDRVMIRLNDHLENGTPYSVEYRRLHESGEYRWQRSQGMALFNEKGKAYRMVGSIQDIHEQKQAEEEKTRLQNRLQQSQRIEALGTLAAGIAHDFNNILYNIIGYAEVALVHQLTQDHPARYSLEEILKASDRATDLVKQIHTFSRKEKQERIKFQASSIVKEALELLKATVPATIEIQEEIAETSDVILAEPSEFHQVLMNLFTNAIHAMRKDGGMLNISLKKKDIGPEDTPFWADLVSGPFLMLTVSDTGHGMDSSVMARIFEPYFTTKPAGEGTGLGLAVVHGIIKGCDGMIKAESSPGKGSLFTVLLPRVEGKETPEPQSSEIIPRGNENLLYLDDSESITKMAKHMLESLGYSVITKTSSIEALKLFRKHPGDFDLVITGMTTPEMTGDALSKEFIRIRPDIPIIVCTGHSELISEKQTKEAGIKAYISKPVTMHELANTIRQVLGNR